MNGHTCKIISGKIKSVNSIFLEMYLLSLIVVPIYNKHSLPGVLDEAKGVFTRDSNACADARAIKTGVDVT